MKVKPLLQCHLLVTGLFPEMVAAAPRLLALEALLALSGQRGCSEGGAESWLCQSFGVAQQSDWPVAPFAALADGLSPDGAYWLRADPVYFHLLRDRIVVAEVVEGWAPGDLALSEAKALIATLNQHFSDDGLQFFAPHASRWYLRLAKQPVLKTHPLVEVIGQDANRFLPHGADAMPWHGWLNEAQMLLHEHPVNLEREQRGQLPVNSVWIWGGGVLAKPVLSPFTAVWAGDVLARGLAQAGGGEIRRLPVSAEEWLENNPEDGMHLMVLEALKKAEENSVDVFESLERHWFAPLLECLKHGRMASIHLDLAQVHQVRSFTVGRDDLWKFWRRPKPLKVSVDG